MGKEFVITNQAQLCDLMCDNIVPKEHEFCLRCGRKLKSTKARELGYGPVCFKLKDTRFHKIKLFN